MSFEVAASAYDRFMGRYSAPLALVLADLAAVEPGRRVLDAAAAGRARSRPSWCSGWGRPVSAVDLSESFVAEARRRHPGVDVHQAPAERLPFGDDAFDAALAQLVGTSWRTLYGLREMGRVTRTDGIVAACVGPAGGGGVFSVFWEAVHGLDPDAEDESQLAGAREGHLGQLCRDAGLRDVEEVRS